MTDQTQNNISSSASPGGRRQSALGKIVKFLIPVAVSVGLCLIMFRDIDFHDMMGVIRKECDFRWIGLMMIMNLFPIMLRALRWGIQLRAAGINAPVHVLLYSIFGTYAVNLVFPRLGEVWRSGYVSYNQNAPFSTVFGSMIADRFADLLTVTLLTLCTFFIAHGPLVEFVRTYPQAYRAILHAVTSPWVWGGIAAVIVVSWLVLTRCHNSYVDKIRKFLKGLWQGFASILHMKAKFQWLGLTLCIWACYFLGLTIAFHAFPLTEQMFMANGVVLPLVCFILTSISMGIPSNGGIGPYQTTLLFGLFMFMPHGMDVTEFKTVGAAFGNVLIASQTLLFIVCGLIVFALIALEKHRGRQRA